MPFAGSAETDRTAIERSADIRAFKTFIVDTVFRQAKASPLARPSCAGFQSRLGRDQMSEWPSSPSISTSVA